MRTKKEYNNIDDIYQMDDEWGIELGIDCAYRALQIQGKVNYDINYGVVLCKRTITNRYMEPIGNGYVLPYAWHVWNEDDDTIYDSLSALNAWGIDASKIDEVLVIEMPIIKTKKQFFKYLHNIAKSFVGTKSPSVIYLSGYGIDIEGHLLNEKLFNEKLDEIDYTHNITGFTQTNVVNYI